jgi:hypothetical protein
MDFLSRIEADAVTVAGSLGADTSEAEDRSKAAVLSLLRDLTERAERGDVLAIGVVTVATNGNLATSIDTGHTVHGWSALLGACSLLTARLVAQGVER